MSNIEKIRQEIERRLKYTHDWLRGDEKRHPKQTAISKNYYKMKGDERTLDALLAFIDSLPEDASCIYDTNKLTPTPSVSIEDVARVQFASHAHVFDRKRKAVFDWEQFKEVAGIFYGFGKRDSLPEETCKDSLQVPETCKENANSFTDDLEKVAAKYERKNRQSLLSSVDIVDAFVAGAEWQANQLLKGSPLPEDTVLFQKGVEEGKRLMMEEAVEGEIGYWNQRGLSIRLDKSLERLGYDMDTKVKIVIVKQDE